MVVLVVARAAPYPAQNLVVEQNIISNIGLGGTAGTGVGIQIDRYLGGGNKIYNNTIFEVQIGLGAYSGSGSINNNAIHMTSNWAMELTPGYTEDFRRSRYADGRWYRFHLGAECRCA